MKNWAERPIEEANLLNPAFCCATLTASIAGYTSVDDAGFPYPLTFMILPIILHKPTSERLPITTRTSLGAWIQDNAEVKVLYAERILSLKPHTREAVRFGLYYGWFALSQGWLLQTNSKYSNIDRILRKFDNESKECISHARLVGKWFASAGSLQTVMALWGIRP